MIDLAELKALSQAGTPGPWEGAESQYNQSTLLYANGVPFAELFQAEVRVGIRKMARRQRQHDAALIVAAVNALPALLDRAERLERAEMMLREIGRADIHQSTEDRANIARAYFEYQP